MDKGGNNESAMITKHPYGNISCLACDNGVHRRAPVKKGFNTEHLNTGLKLTVESHALEVATLVLLWWTQLLAQVEALLLQRPALWAQLHTRLWCLRKTVLPTVSGNNEELLLLVNLNMNNWLPIYWMREHPVRKFNCIETTMRVSKQAD